MQITFRTNPVELADCRTNPSGRSDLKLGDETVQLRIGHGARIEHSAWRRHFVQEFSLFSLGHGVNHPQNCRYALAPQLARFR
jgi:hypothetical protein